jgi:hypothetical protein
MAPERSFSNLICKHVNRRYIEPAHLDYKALVAIFFVDKFKSKVFEIDVETFVSALNEGSFNVKLRIFLKKNERSSAFPSLSYMNCRGFGFRKGFIH